MSKPHVSCWNPPVGRNATLDLYINLCEHKINQLISTGAKRVNHNISSSEYKALRNLSNNHELVIKPADKGGAVVVWRKDLYIAEALRQLSDTTFYEHLDVDATTVYNKKIHSTINKLISEGDLPSNAKSLLISHPRTSRFYLLPEIHKPDNPGRPINIFLLRFNIYPNCSKSTYLCQRFYACNFHV